MKIKGCVILNINHLRKSKLHWPLECCTLILVMTNFTHSIINNSIKKQSLMLINVEL
jgi:hypothetical protein